MILFTDGGSTKCDWVLLNSEGKKILQTQTLGLNPTVVPKEELENRILYNPELREVMMDVTQVDFYGAGCGTKTPRGRLQQVLELLFVNAQVTVREDLAAAVYAVTTTAGIVCILGTGSNSCYFDGSTIHAPIPALGYSIMDEASGNYYGKQLLRDFFYGKMPEHLAEKFENTFEVSPDSIKDSLYQKSNPNAYLASFAQFIFAGEITEPYFKSVIEEGIENFINARILTFTEAREVPIHFIGSIAHFSKAIIEQCFAKRNLQLGTIVQRPMDGLVAYYQNTIKKTYE